MSLPLLLLLSAASGLVLEELSAQGPIRHAQGGKHLLMQCAILAYVHIIGRWGHANNARDRGMQDSGMTHFWAAFSWRASSLASFLCCFSSSLAAAAATLSSAVFALARPLKRHTSLTQLLQPYRKGYWPSCLLIGHAIPYNKAYSRSRLRPAAFRSQSLAKLQYVHAWHQRRYCHVGTITCRHLDLNIM